MSLSKKDGKADSWIGQPIQRFEDRPLVTGQGSFTADLKAELYARFVRSPVASGKIVRIAAPEGTILITAKDLVGVQPIHLILQNFNYIPVEQTILARDVVRFVGEPVAVVLAETMEAAEDAADQVELEIAEIDPIVTIEQALALDAALVHEHVPGNIVVDANFSSGPAPENAFKRVRAEVRTCREAALPLETRQAHAAFDRVSGRLTLTCTTQSPHLFRTAIADILAIPESKLRVVAPDVGGGFGQKATLPPEFPVVAWLALHFKTSVGWHEDRRENLLAGFHARDARLSVEGYFDETGKLLGIDADVQVNVGAYSSFPTSFAVEPAMALNEMPGVYDFQNYRCRSRGITTNTCPMAPYRGVARPMIVLVIERMFDKAAAQFGIEPTELRRRNFIRQFPYKSVTGLTYDEATYAETMEMAVKAIDLPTFRLQQAQARAENRYLGLGFATFSERTGFGTQTFAARKMQFTMGWEQADVTMDPSGFVEVRTGASPHGQGLRTTIAQIVADEIGIAPDQITVICGDTDNTPYGWGTFASRSLVIAGGASKLAAAKLRGKLQQIAGHLLEASAEDVVIERGVARIAGTDRALAVSSLARTAYHQLPKLGGKLEPGLKENATYDPYGTFSNACHAAIVEVDAETGKVEIKRYIVMEDAGRLINPLIVDGQIHGGVVQGIANALLEEIIYDDTGNVLTTTLADFLPPTSLDVPTIEIGHIETWTNASVTHAKGLGEGGTIGPPAAVLNAINDAIAPFAVQIDEIPATPRRIHAALTQTKAPTT
ncbi:MAG: aerobic carbon-monoxide dehydrogenase large subunit [Bradyrhizobium sp.]|nr:aerobic carbon-monoxide dehydrogenase large subunit [Bradyrhizobium sp.]